MIVLLTTHIQTYIFHLCVNLDVGTSKHCVTEHRKALTNMHFLCITKYIPTCFGKNSYTAYPFPGLQSYG